jgi:hypothetical protein
MTLTAEEKQEILSAIDAGQQLPAKFRAALFPWGALDAPAHIRASAFNVQFAELRGADWTAIHFAPASATPPAHFQIAWPWRRELWTTHFICRRSLGRAYCHYSTGDWASWSPAQRELERLCHLTNALTSHNAMEDRIAQLSNSFRISPIPQKKIEFKRFFEKESPPSFPNTNSAAAKVLADSDWIKTHDRANDLKHRWTGEVMSQLPKPETVRQQLGSRSDLYICYGTIQVTPEDVDRICEATQRSLNLLTGLAKTLDTEIGWSQYFAIGGLESAVAE